MSRSGPKHPGLTRLAAQAGLNRSTVSLRLSAGMTIEQALTAPLRPMPPRVPHAEMLRALRGSQSVKAAAAELGMSCSLLRSRAKKDPQLADAIAGLAPVRRAKTASNLPCPVGERSGSLVALGEAPLRVTTVGSRRRWVVRCDCGDIMEIDATAFRIGRATMCRKCRSATRAVHGCAATKGRRATNEYEIWSGLKSRCKNPNSESYADYGGRGIKVCERWEKFENFLADMGPRPSRAHSVERVDNGKGYGPDNCIWATLDVQAVNRRDNRRITHDGVTKTLSAWARQIGISHYALSTRLEKLSVSEALTRGKKQNVAKRSGAFVEYQGEQRVLEELGALFGLPVYVIRGRLRLGWDIERALTTPNRGSGSRRGSG